ncbi:MAG: HlyD family efflux transporter periplasmic adaptor subunit [Clostridia bacterium]
MKKGILLILVTLSIIFLVLNKNRTNLDENMEIQTIFAEKSTIINQIIAKGNIEEKNKSYVCINQNGIVEKVNFVLGDKVSTGDILMTVKSNDLQYNQTNNSIFDLFSNKSITILDTGNVGEFDIISNVNGVITSIPTNVGESILSGVPFLSICDTENLIARVSISEKNVKETKIGQEVIITGDSFEEEIYGEIIQIMPYTTTNLDILSSSNTVTVEAIVELDEFAQEIIIGCSIEAKITVDEKNDAITVPFDAIFQENTQEYVYILENNTIFKREIVSGYEVEEKIEIISGITQGEQIVIAGDVFDGQEVINEE